MLKKIFLFFLLAFSGFAVNAQTLDLVSPNGGENYATNSSQFIVWTSSGVGNVKIEFSADGGSNWSIVQTSVATSPGVGFYNWTAPAGPSSTCRVRITDVATPSLSDMSAANFSISSPTIAITSPNGGEIIGVGTNYTINWTSVGVSSARLEYTINNGSTWNIITNSVSATSGSYNWTNVPNTPSSQCKIRITDISNALVSDQSNNIFTIVVPSLVLTSPNGGEVLTGATTQQIFWNSSGIGSSVTLKYSTDGIVWNTISAFATNNGNYSWSVPNTSTACAKVAVIDNTNPSIADTSNACFTINASPGTVTVFAPNGGEVWGVGTSRQITWSSSFINNVKIEYSTDNGSSWTTIVGTYTASFGSYNWTVPATVSANCKVRISDVTNPSFFDVSNVIFSIVNPLATVTYPNGGEVLTGNSSTTVYWTSAGLSNTVDLFYSTNNGSTWTQFGFCTNNDGNQFWSIPNTPSTSCKIRVRDCNAPFSEDVSDAVFTIAAPVPTITVTTPNGGENWSVGSGRNIFWNSQYVNNVNIDYSVDNGATWVSIATNYSAGSGSYFWPTVPASATCLAKIKITDAANASVFDVSNNTFCITNPSVTVTAPNGAETFTANTSTTVYWTSAGLSSNVNLYYSTDGGAIWTQFGFCTTNDGNQSWSIPSTLSNQYRIKVEDCSSPFTMDISDANFTVVAPVPTIVLSQPNGGEIYGIGSNQTIFWTGSNLSAGVNLEFSTDNGSTWTTIATYTSSASSGSYPWVVPAVTPSTSCLVRVTALANASVFDVSNNNFSIVAPALTLVDPNGGQILNAGSNYTIRWSNVGLTGSVKLELSTDGGTSYPTIITSSVSVGSNQYNWTVNNLPSTQCRVKITSNSITTLTDVSNANFTILPPAPSITVSSPNGGEYYGIGTNQTISWSCSNLSAGNKVNIFMSTDNGATWNTVASSYTSGASSGSYNVPSIAGPASSACLVRIEDAVNPTYYDQSNNLFNIVTRYINVTVPNGGEVWNIGTNYQINWSSLAVPGNARVLLSRDGGTTYPTTLTNSASSSNLYSVATNSYNWTATGPASTTCKIKVVDASDNTVIDESNANFSINPAVPSITVSSPNGGEIIGVGTNTSINWSCSNLSTSNLVNIEYSTDNGSTWNTIISSYTSGSFSGSYNWIGVPNTPSVNCKVRVSDVGILTSNDASNNVFSIVTPAMFVTGPNGGETFTALTNNTIYWNGTGFNGNVDLAYKTSIGAPWTNIATNISNGGSYNWFVPNTPTACAKVRVRSSSYSAIADSSDACFTIAAPVPSITVNSPNGGESYGVGSNQSISWSSANVATVKIELSLDNGATYPTTLTASTSAGTGFFNWNNIPNTPSCLAKIRISDISNPTIFDVSNSTFCIVDPSLTVSNPNGGETWVANNNYTINWFSQGTSAFSKIEVSTNGGGLYQNITNFASNGSGGVASYNWFINTGTITGLPSANCKIRVTDNTASPTAPKDSSDNVFTINLPPPSITVTAPNGGQNWVVGTNQNISWSASFVSNLKIEYTTDNGATWILINASVPASNGSLLWTVPNTPSSLCKVRISDAANPTTYFDLSNNVFNIISPSITLVTPNCGELWNGASNYTIYWSGSGLSSSVKLEYSTNNGSTWNSINNFVFSSSNGGSYNWNVPNTPSTIALVRITDNGNTSLVDVSNCNFTILSPNPYITVTYPNGGQTFGTNNNVTITWQSAYVSNVNIEYYDGSSWQIVANNISAASGSYIWTTPAVANSFALIRVSDAANGTIIDQSNFSFAIVTPSVTVTSPNGGENLTAGNTHNITWNTTGVSNYVKIRISLDNGANYSVVSNSEYNDGFFTWTVPNTPSNNALIEISDYNNPLVKDASNFTFEINSAPASVTLTSPNGGQIFATGSTQYITWNSLSITNVNIEFSSNSGGTYTPVVSNYNAATGVYTWTVPSTVSDNCLIRISDASNAAVNDVSNQVFEIAAPYITVTAPNGGNNLIVGNNYYITWASLGVNNVKVEFSTNGGTTWTALATNATNTGYFYWQVPNQLTSAAKIRVSSVATPSINDASDANFSIINATPDVTLNTPNGGQYWYAGSSYYINWTSTGVANVKLEYTINNGTSWTDIVASIPAASGYYYWNVPITPSTQCKVRISNAANFSVNDESNAVFTIASPTPYLQVNYPNGNENFYIGSYENISWTNNNVTAVNVELSRNGGGSWVTLATSYTGSTYYWNVTAPASTNCLVRVTDYFNAAMVDISNGPFNIVTTSVNTNTITTSAVATPICKGATIDVDFTQAGTFNLGNVYTAQLSDAFGNFSNPMPIGSFSGITPSTIQCVIPTSIPNGTGYRIRVVASNLATTGANNGTDLVIKSPEFDFSVPASQLLKYLPDGQVDFTYNGVTTDIISYTWQFGNGDESTLQNPTYNYTQIGFYDITLTAINDNNCVTTLTKPTYIRVERLFTNTLLNSGTTARITGASFVNPDKGCFALEDGNCIVTSDSGATFVPSITGSTVGLTGAALKSGAWYVSGKNGTVMKSGDQGATWTPIASSTTNDMNSVSFANPDTGFVVGNNGSILKIENGIAVPQTAGVAANLTGVSAIFDEAYAVGENGTIVHYNGSSWSTMPSPVSSNFTSILMYEYKATKGYACDEGGSIIRYDAGTWSVSLSGVDVAFKSIAGYQNDSAWVSATEGIVYVTYDGGDTWGRYSVGSTTDMNTIVFKDGRGYVAGNDGEARRFLGDAASDGSLSNPTIPTTPTTTTTVAVDETAKSMKRFTTYPVPAYEELNIETSFDQMTSFKIVLKDMRGTEVSVLFNGETKGNFKQTVDVSPLANGIYFLHVNEGDRSYVRKIVVNK